MSTTLLYLILCLILTGLLLVMEDIIPLPTPTITLTKSHILYTLLVTTLLLTLHHLYHLFFTPLNYKCTKAPKPETLKAFEGTPLLYKNRKLGDFPPPYPNGWYVLSHSDDLRKGDVRPLNVLGGQFVLWRDLVKGEAHLFDAYCPHMGANLAFGGEVHGNCITCPFHGWQFDGTGACASIPETGQDFSNIEKIQKAAKAHVHTILEMNHIIYYWYDAEKREPTWYPPEMPQITQKKFTYHGKTDHQVLAHIQELPENGADIAHLHTLHPKLFFPWLLTHHWDATWALKDDYTNKGEPHVTQIELDEHVHIFGIRMKFLDVKVKIHQIGPGIVWLHFYTPFGQALVCGAVTPYGPMVQRTYHMIFTSGTIPRVLGKAMVYMLGQFYEQDMLIWQWKTYPQKPILDKNIQRFRKWFSQFYSENSISFDDAVSVYGKGRSAVPLDW